jgi:hypothetical protein
MHRRPSKLVQNWIRIGVKQILLKRLAQENGVFSEIDNNLYIERTNRRSKTRTMSCGNLPDVFLGLRLWDLYCAKKILQTCTKSNLTPNNNAFSAKMYTVYILKNKSQMQTVTLSRRHFSCVRASYCFQCNKFEWITYFEVHVCSAHVMNGCSFLF